VNDALSVTLRNIREHERAIKKTRADACCAETVEDEIEIEDLCDHALERLRSAASEIPSYRSSYVADAREIHVAAQTMLNR